MNADPGTHENENPVDIISTALDHLNVFFLHNLWIHGKKPELSRKWKIPRVS